MRRSTPILRIILGGQLEQLSGEQAGAPPQGALMEADFGHHGASVRSVPPTTSASACLYIYLNTTCFGRGIHKHSAFNYRSTGMWETAEEIINFPCTFRCGQA